MTPTEVLTPNVPENSERTSRTKAAAAGLFGYSISDGNVRSLSSVGNYIRDIEQMPNFTPPIIELFTAQFIKNNMGTG